MRLCIYTLMGIFLFSNCGVRTIANTPIPFPPTIVIAGNIYYVSANGNDVNPGTHAQPWKTINKVNSQMSTFGPGDSILFKRGDTWVLNSGGESGSLVISASGSAGNPITFGAYGEGNLPIFDGMKMKDAGIMWKGEVIIDNVSYVTIEYLDLYNAIKQQIGIGIDGGNSSYITIQDCVIRTNRTNGFMNIVVMNHGNQGDTHDIVIRDNEIYDSRWNGMRITGGVANVVISGNMIHDIIHNGIDTYPSNINNKNFQIYDNTIYDFGIEGGAGIYIPGASFFVIYDNDIYNSLGAPSYGIKVGSVADFNMDKITVRNNRIWNVDENDSNTYGLWFNNCMDCIVSNNTLYQNHKTMLDLNNVRFSVENNLAYANSQDQPSLRNFPKDPKFVNPAAGNFNLEPASPACTAGESMTYIGAFSCD